jgi:hypothetical protein
MINFRFQISNFRFGRVDVPAFGLVVLALLALLAGPARGAVYNLRADVTTITLPGGERVGMWGFARDSSFGAGDGRVTIPGPLLTVGAGDTTLTVRLKNNLTPARTGLAGGTTVSLIIPALPGRLAPVYWDADTSYAGRVRSLNTETPPGNAAPVEYTWTGVKPGTYLYHSATQMQVQVQMGLYGGVAKDADLRTAYPGVAYDQAELLFYSEIDPDLHRAVVRGEYGPGRRVSSTLDYHPRYFLVNGAPYTKAAPLRRKIMNGRRTLLRMINAGLESHVPLLQGGYYELIAENGNPYPAARRQYAPLLAAGQTLDALVTPGAAGTLAIFDRMMNLTNDRAAPGGLMSYLDVAGPAGGAPAARGDAYAVNENRTLWVGGAGVLANDVNPTGSAALAARLVSGPQHGTLTLRAGGAFSYAPQRDFTGRDSFSYKADNAAFASAAATVAITVNPVNDPPTALARHYTAALGAALAVPAPGVLLGARDPEGRPLRAVKAADPARGTLRLEADGSFTYQPAAGAAPGTVTFSYRASDGVTQSAAATVTVKLAKLDAAPLAAANSYGTMKNKPLVVAAPGVLANDRDPDGDTLMALPVLMAGQPAKGTVAVRPDGSFTYTPRTGATGKDTFKYTASDGAKSTAATVTVTIN